MSPGLARRLAGSDDLPDAPGVEAGPPGQPPPGAAGRSSAVQSGTGAMRLVGDQEALEDKGEEVGPTALPSSPSSSFTSVPRCAVLPAQNRVAVGDVEGSAAAAAPQGPTPAPVDPPCASSASSAPRKQEGDALEAGEVSKQPLAASASPASSSAGPAPMGLLLPQTRAADSSIGGDEKRSRVVVPSGAAPSAARPSPLTAAVEWMQGTFGGDWKGRFHRTHRLSLARPLVYCRRCGHHCETRQHLAKLRSPCEEPPKGSVYWSRLGKINRGLHPTSGARLQTSIPLPPGTG